MGQRPHFIGHHGETTPGFPGSRCFDRGVQGQQVGLVSQATDHVQHFTDIPRFIGQVANQGSGGLHVGTHAFDSANGFLHQVATVTGGGGGIARGFGGAHRVACDFFHRAGHLVDGSGGLFDFVVLLGQATGAFVGDRIQLFSGRRQLGSGAGDTLQGVAQFVLHLGHGREQAPGFVVAVHTDRARQVAFGHFFGGF